MVKKLDWHEEKQLRKELHPLLHFNTVNDFKTFPNPIPEDFGSFVAGGYQRRNMSEEELRSLSAWLYTLEPNSVINDYGFKFRNPQDAMVYKLKWAASVPGKFQEKSEDD